MSALLSKKAVPLHRLSKSEKAYGVADRLSEAKKEKVAKRKIIRNVQKGVTYCAYM